MKLPFSLEQFLKVFEDFNTTWWPFQFLLYLPAGLGIAVILTRNRQAHLIVFSVLGFLWTWMGAAYHLAFFSTINPAALYFGIAFILQGLLFFYYGIFRKAGFILSRDKIFFRAGIALLLIALVIYPLTGYLLGHRYPAAPVFGLPCPTTIFTFGILLFSAKKIPGILLVIPVAWSIIGFSASFTLGIKEDSWLIISSLVFISLTVSRKKLTEPPAHA